MRPLYSLCVSVLQFALPQINPQRQKLKMLRRLQEGKGGDKICWE